MKAVGQTDNQETSCRGQRSSLQADGDRSAVTRSSQDSPSRTQPNVAVAK